MTDEVLQLIRWVSVWVGIQVDPLRIEALVRRSLEDWARLTRVVEPGDEP